MNHRSKPWTPNEIARLKKLVTRVSYAKAAARLGRTEYQVFRKTSRLGGLRRLALEARLTSAGVLRKLLRKAGEATIFQWRNLGLKYRVLGGMSSGGGRGSFRGGHTKRTKGSYFYSLPDVIAFLKSRPRLIITLHPAARRMLKLELPETGPKFPAPSQTPEYRRARYTPVPKRPCDVCGRGMIASTTRYGVCTKTAACRKEWHRRVWAASRTSHRQHHTIAMGAA